MLASNLTMICELWAKFENGFGENLANVKQNIYGPDSIAVENKYFSFL